MRLTLNITGVDALRERLKEFPKALARAERNAANTTATAVKAAGIEEAFKMFHVDKKARLKKDSRGRDTVFIRRAREGEAAAVVTFKRGASAKSGDLLGLQHFKTDTTDANVKEKGWRPHIQLKRNGQIKKVAGGFYGMGRLKGLGIFERRGRKLTRRTGLSLHMMVKQPEVLKNVLQIGRSLFAKLLETAIEKQIAKIKQR